MSDSQRTLLNGLDQFGDDLDAKTGDRLSFALFHEAYHVGQLGILRRIAGHPGATK